MVHNECKLCNDSKILLKYLHTNYSPKTCWLSLFKTTFITKKNLIHNKNNLTNKKDMIFHKVMDMDIYEWSYKNIFLKKKKTSSVKTWTYLLGAPVGNLS